MTNASLIPPRKELGFAARLIGIMVASLAIASGLLFLFLNTSVGGSYREAVKALAGVRERLALLVILAIIFQLVFALIATGLTVLLFSHKIAGPIFRLKAYLREAAEGREPGPLRFRRADFMLGVQELFNGLFADRRRRRALLTEAESLAAGLASVPLGDREASLQRIEAILVELES
jgi:hypothetical protein